VLANQWRAPAVAAIGKTIAEVIAPLASTDRSGDEKNTQPTSTTQRRLDMNTKTHTHSQSKSRSSPST
jgi:hypothetical protein